MNEEQQRRAVDEAENLMRHRDFILEGALRVALQPNVNLAGVPPVDVAAQIVFDYYELIENTLEGQSPLAGSVSEEPTKKRDEVQP